MFPRYVGCFLLIWSISWVLISLGQSAASGKPLVQCLLSSKHDCGPTPQEGQP
jgi:hypothetical protein